MVGVIKNKYISLYTMFFFMFYAFNREYSSRTHYSECCWYHCIIIRSTKIFAPLSSFVDHVFVFSSLTSYSPCMLALHDRLKHHNVLYHVYVFCIFSSDILQSLYAGPTRHAQTAAGADQKFPPLSAIPVSIYVKFLGPQISLHNSTGH